MIRDFIRFPGSIGGDGETLTSELHSMTYRAQCRHQYQDNKVQLDLMALQPEREATLRIALANMLNMHLWNGSVV